MSNPFSPAVQPRLHNLFFAVRPPIDCCRRMAELTAALPVGGKPMRIERLHITLLTLVLNGIAPAGLAEEAAEVAASVRAAPFNVMLDHLVGGPKSTLLLSGEPLEALRMFRERLGFMLMRAGLDFRLDIRFEPHVTLLYGNETMFADEVDPFIWRVEDFVLIDSVIGETRHIELGRWPLRA